MARLRSGGLRQLSTPPKKIKGMSNAEKCKQYREALKKDPERNTASREKNLERAKRSYYRPRTEEELEIRRAKDRERKRAYRARRKDDCAVQVTPQPKPKTKSSIKLITTNGGLRQLSTPKKIKGMSNAEKCKQYREALKKDPERNTASRKKNLERAKRSYYRPRTEEELEIRRAKDREHKRAYRAHQKDVCGVQITAQPKPKTKSTQPKPKTKSSIASQRQAWVQTQKKSRERWTSQKWQSHRERCRQYYYKMKAAKEKRTPPAMETTAATGDGVPPQQFCPAVNCIPQPPDIVQTSGTPGETDPTLLKKKTVPSPPNKVKSPFKLKLSFLKSKSR